MEQEMKKQEMIYKVNEQVENKICEIVDKGIKEDNIDMLGILVDVHKDLANEEYWDKKKEVMSMRYRESGGYGNYGREGYGRRGRDSRGRYTERGRGYRGDEMMEEMYEAYQAYSEGSQSYNEGNYGAKGEAKESLEDMMECMVSFMEVVKENANSPEEMQVIKKYTKKISEMI